MGIAAAALLLIALGAASQYHARMQAETAAWVTHTHLVIESLHQMLGGLSSAESCVRGLGLTRDPRLLRCFDHGLEELRSSERKTHELTRDNAEQQHRLRALAPRLERRIALLIAARDRAQDVGQAFSVSPEAIDLTEGIRATASEMIATERKLLAQRALDAERRAQLMLISLWAVLIGTVTLGGAAFALLSSEMRRRAHAEREIKARHAEQAVLLNLGELLQACRSLAESIEVIVRLARTIFSGHSGALHLFRPSRDLLERQAAWGELAANDDKLFSPDECWALRRGSVHRVGGDSDPMYCKHVTAPLPGATLCLPMMGHGDVIGVLSLSASREISADERRLATLAAEQISMALGNMLLRESLRNQSIRDPLTGLFNRRYAEETLPRELHRATRERTSVGVLMADVDHFKRFNDTFGHEAGDYVLKEIARALCERTRKGDVVSRMGGEELLVVLVGSDVEQSLLKAEALRATIAALALAHRGIELGPITISIGVAVSPLHGAEPNEVLRVADRALYRAKLAGRNRVELADRPS